MALFCGIYALDRRRDIPFVWRDWLRSNLSRSGIGQILEHNEAGFFAAALDFGAFEAPGWRMQPGTGLTILAGDTLLEGRRAEDDRSTDLQVLHELDPRHLGSRLRDARGNFCALHYRSREHLLSLATDRLGYRPVYVIEKDGYIAFSGAKRLILGLPGVEFLVDLRGVAELAALGFSLADRTEVAGVRSLRGGQVFRAEGGSSGMETYWRWGPDACGRDPGTENELIADLFREFDEGIRMRLGNARAAYAGLSGGLDTRCVVAGLRSRGVAVTSIDVAWDGSLDQILGRAFAEAIGTKHVEKLLPIEGGGRDLPKISWDAMRECEAGHVGTGIRRRQLWGGNDGAMSIGYAFIGERTIQLLRAYNFAAAAEQFLADMAIVSSPRPYQGKVADAMAELPLLGVREELANAGCADPGFSLYAILLENHQRKQLAWHYEDIDLFPFEHIQPFFDSKFLEVACRIPPELGFRHRFYHRWLAAFPPQTVQVPWQAYPGHETCPLPLPRQHDSQWTLARHNNRLYRRELVRDSVRMLTRWKRASSLLSRARISTAVASVALGRASTAYILKQSLRLWESVERCEGRFDASSLMALQQRFSSQSK